MHLKTVMERLCAAGMATFMAASPTFGQATGEARGAARKGSQVLIGHALSMAIESSNLSSKAPESIPTTRDARERSASDRRPSLREIEARNNAADVRRSTAASQAPGATPVEPYGSGKTAGEIQKEVAERTGAARAAAPAEPAAVRPDPVAAFAHD